MHIITGATGFVGSALTQSLLAEGKKVMVVSRGKDCLPGADLLTHDLREPLPDIKNLSATTLVHCAAEIKSDKWMDHWEGNITATRNVLDWAVKLGIQRIVHISTGSVYGSIETEACEDTPVHPDNYYAHSKYLAEHLCHTYEDLFGLSPVIYRLYFPYSINQVNGLFHFLRKSILDGTEISLNVGGTPYITPTAIADVVSAITLSLSQRFPSGIYNLCGDEVVSIGEIISGLEIALSKKAVIRHTGQHVPHITASNRKLRLTGWSPRFQLADYFKSIAGDSEVKTSDYDGI